MSPKKLNFFLILKLPLAYFAGVRVKFINEETCKVAVKYNWINKNPFKSMFWAVQGMAAELSTGALMMKKVKESGKNISILVASNNAIFTKKAKGKIIFTCNEGLKMNALIEKAITTGQGQTLWVNAVGMDENKTQVSSFNFEWTVKVK